MHRMRKTDTRRRGTERRCRRENRVDLQAVPQDQHLVEKRTIQFPLHGKEFLDWQKIMASQIRKLDKRKILEPDDMLQLMWVKLARVVAGEVGNYNPNHPGARSYLLRAAIGELKHFLAQNRGKNKHERILDRRVHEKKFFVKIQTSCQAISRKWDFGEGAADSTSSLLNAAAVRNGSPVERALEERELMKIALSKLNWRQREMVLMYHGEDWTKKQQGTSGETKLSDIAEKYGISPQTVSNILKRARAKIRNTLIEEGYAQP